MKTLIRSGILLLAVLAFTATAPADEAPWCDMANCAMCTSISSRPELVSALKSEIHDIANGMVWACSVPDAQVGDYKAAMAEMGATGLKLQAGETLHVCGMCQAMMGLVASGAKLERVETGFGSVDLLTSATPEGVAQIHAWAERTRNEMAKAMQAEGEAKE